MKKLIIVSMVCLLFTSMLIVSGCNSTKEVAPTGQNIAISGTQTETTEKAVDNDFETAIADENEEVVIGEMI